MYELRIEKMKVQISLNETLSSVDLELSHTKFWGLLDYVWFGMDCRPYVLFNTFRFNGLTIDTDEQNFSTEENFEPKLAGRKEDWFLAFVYLICICLYENIFWLV